MKNLIIIGAGGCGREILQWAKDINKKDKTWNIKGFLDDDANALNNKKCDTPILSSIDAYDIQEEDVFICGIGDSGTRKTVVQKMKDRGAKFVNIIHPTAIVADSCTLGEGVILYPFALVSANAIVSDGCIINMHSSVAHDATLGCYCTISSYCDITGMCTIGDEVFMGTSAKLVPGTKVGDHAFICAGSMVMTRIREGVKVMGNPAKKIAF